jgi:hypothetical protein
MRTRPLLALLALAACGGGDATAPLVTLEAVSDDESCPAGGVVVTVGDDADGDGVLTGDEIDERQVVCHGDDGAAGPDGADGTSAVLRTTRLDRGDADCPYGGVRVEAGLDDGSGGGTAADGTLQDGEVDDTAFVCDGASAFDVADLDPPAGPAAAYTVDVSGGDGAGSCGGEGGSILVGSDDDGFAGGHVKVFATGVADASFTLPTVTTDLGPNPLEVTTDLTLSIFPDTDCDSVPNDASGLTAGQIYQVSCWAVSGRPGYSLLRWNGSSGDVITGMHVAPGASITFAVPTPANSLQLIFEFDVVNEGVISILGNQDHNKILNFGPRVFHGKPGSRFDLRASADSVSFSHLIVQTAGAIVNEGTVDVRGRAGGDGGAASLYAGQGLWNTGDVLASGGDGATGHGGDGGSIALESYAAGLRNRGRLDARAGNGAGDAGHGGDGGIVKLTSSDGDLRNEGDADASAGDGSPTCDAEGDCRGGDARDHGDGAGVAVHVQGGRLVSTGDLRADGGDGTGLGRGGDAGPLELLVSNGELTAARGIEVSGGLVARGGTGRRGGTGGSLDVLVGLGERRQLRSAIAVTAPVEVVLYGYEGLDTHGGDSAGACEGAPAGDVTLANDCPSEASAAAGGAVLFADVRAIGGDATDAEGGSGGEGGEVGLWTCTSPDRARFAGGNVALVGGSVDARGGSSAGGQGGDGTYVTVSAYEWAEIRGTVDASGGAGVDGGSGGYLDVYGTGGRASVSAALTCDGGEGVEEGGDAGQIEVLGLLVDVSAELSCDGGDGVDGGAGGGIEVLSLDGTSVVTAPLHAAAGTGTEQDGRPGAALIDGFGAP